MAREQQEQQQQWEFKREVSLGSLLTIFVMVGGMFTYSMTWENRITRVEARLESNELRMREQKADVAARLDKIDERLSKIQDALNHR
jgi:hypothetical protein